MTPPGAGARPGNSGRPSAATPRRGPLLVVQPSLDYAARVARTCPDLLCVAHEERAAALRAAGHAALGVPLGDATAAASALEAHCAASGCRPAGIVTFVCEHLAVTAALALRLGLSFYRPEQVEWTRHKDRTAARWRAAAVAVPGGCLVRSETELLAFAARHPGPWVLKPEDGTGSEWVLMVHEAARLAEAHQRLQAGLTAAGRDAVYLAQTFVRGREVSADLWVDGDRLAVPRLTEKHLLSGEGLAGVVGAYYPARFDEATFAHLASVYRRAVAALGIERGLVMVDGILSGGELNLLELGLRPGGDCLPDLCRAATGYDPVAAACRAAVGRTPDLPDWRHAAPVAAVHLITGRHGTIRRIDTARLAADPRVLHVELYHEAGEELRQWAGSYDDRILAAAIVRCHDPASLPELGRELLHLIDLDLEDDHGARRRA